MVGAEAERAGDQILEKWDATVRGLRVWTTYQSKNAPCTCPSLGFSPWSCPPHTAIQLTLGVNSDPAQQEVWHRVYAVSVPD